MTPQRFAAIRALIGMTQAQLGNRLGLTVGTISRLENGKQAIRATVGYSMLYLEYGHNLIAAQNNDHTRNDRGQYDHEL